MNTAQLLQHFAQIAEAPDAVTSLRHFILDLAVRGKLVPHDPNDKPASELVKRIEAKKGQLLKERKLQAAELFDPIEEDELLFSIPTGWQVIRMGWLALKLGAGSTPLGGKSVYQSEGVPFLRSQNVHDNGLRLNDVALIPRTIHERMAGTHIQRQDLLLNITGASIGRCALVPDDFVEGNVSQHVAIIRLFEPAIREFIHLALISPSYQKLIMDVQVGVSREGLSMQRLKLFPMVIPPLGEQHRIVAKVDELMALCDQLEAAQAQRETHRDQLVAATLHSLTAAETGDLAARAHFFFNHLPRLTTRPAHIQQLRQTILNLAVRGKLVPQDPENEVPDINEKVQRERKYYGHPFIITGDSLDSYYEAKESLSIPLTWTVAPLSEIALAIVDCPHSTPQWTPTGKICVRTNQFRPGLLDLSNSRFVSEETFVERIEKLRPKENDILYSREGGILGIACRVPSGIDLCLGQRMMLIRSASICDPVFLEMVLNSPYITDIATKKTTGGAAPRVNVSTVKSYPIPLPPLAEQQRIVAKVDELMALCAELETQLTATTNTRRQLLAATLHEALQEGT